MESTPLSAGPNVFITGVSSAGPGSRPTSVHAYNDSGQQPLVQAARVGGLPPGRETGSKGALSQHDPEHITLWLAISSPQLAMHVQLLNSVHTSGYAGLVQAIVAAGLAAGSQQLSGGQVGIRAQVPTVLPQAPAQEKAGQVPGSQLPR